MGPTTARLNRALTSGRALCGDPRNLSHTCTEILAVPRTFTDMAFRARSCFVNTRISLLTMKLEFLTLTPIQLTTKTSKNQKESEAPWGCTFGMTVRFVQFPALATATTYGRRKIIAVPRPEHSGIHHSTIKE